MTTTKRRKTDRVIKAEYELLAAFRYALRRFMRFSEEGAASVGLRRRTGRRGP